MASLGIFSVYIVCVGVLSLGLGQWGVTVGAVVFTEVIGSLGVGGNQQLLDVSLENLLIKQTGSEHCDAIGVDHGVVAAGQGTGHLLLAVQQQCHVFL